MRKPLVVLCVVLCLVCCAVSVCANIRFVSACGTLEPDRTLAYLFCEPADIVKY